jgi:hypothetical protein
MKQSPRASRFQAGIPAELHYEGKDYPCVGRSLSRTGILLVGHVPWPSEPEVPFSLRTASGDLQLELVGRVVHAFRSEDDGEMRLGLQFDQLDDKRRATLESLINRVTEGVAPAPLEMLPRGATPRQVREALDSIPVAHRISLAARAQLKERRFLNEDSNLQVMEGLARNPNISAQEIRELARRPNLLPSTLDLIANDRRWFNDEELKIILVTHPRTKLAIAEEIVARMSDRSLKKVLRSPGLHPTLKSKLLARFSGKELAGW